MSATERLSKALVLLSRRGDLVIALIVLIAVTMMIIPLPTWLVDILIAVNISVSMLVLLVSFSIFRPIEFSSLPSVILITTLFRLSITITTSRLILMQANAGDIVTAFGEFVVGGMVVVGLTIFLIITIAQFLVITKGAERVAEVAARFTLDALPGKQMSIDSDLRNGDITKEDAKHLRQLLERESQLYGAMDGAMKFVKGDAIASLVIILVNLIGGLMVGTITHGMSLSGAVEKYSLLTVGDGLVAQIPALLVSVGAGTVITRVESEVRSDLGSDIARQLTDARALLLGAPIMVALAIVPGFPSPIFLILAVMFGAGGYLILRRKKAQAAPQAADGALPAVAVERAMPEEKTPALEKAAQRKREAIMFKPSHGLTVCIGSNLALKVRPAAFQASAAEARTRLQSDLGVEAPDVTLYPDQSLDPNRFRFELEGVPVFEGEVPAESLLVDDDTTHLELAEIPYRDGQPFGGYRRVVWVDNAHEGLLWDSGVRYLPPLEVLSDCLTYTLKRYAAHFVGVQEAHKMLALVQKDYPDLVKETEKICSLQKTAEVLRRLVEENVPIRSLRPVLEAIVEWGQRESDTVLLVEYVRTNLGRQICHRCADENRVVGVFMLERPLEELLRSGIQMTAVGSFLAISEDVTRPFVDRLRSLHAEAPAGVQPVVVTAMDLRRHVRNLLTRANIDLPVLSYQELAPEFGVQVLAVVRGEADAKDFLANGHWELNSAAEAF